MQIKKIEKVEFTDNEGKFIHIGDRVVVTFKTDYPDVIGLFGGVNNRNMILIDCHNRTFAFKQSSIEDCQVVE